MRRSWSLIPLVVFVCALGVGDAVAAGGSALSEEQWRRRVNTICRRDAARALEIRRDAFGDLAADEQPSLELITAYVKGIEPLVDGLVDDIDALREPKKLEKKVHRFVKTARHELARLVDDPSIGLEGNPFSDTGLRVEALGLKSCV